MIRIIQSLALASTLLISAQADFLLTLTDKAGVEDNICVKSYAFTNNLESIHNQQNQTIDEYSTEETLTNKRFLGKPVYRVVIPAPDFTMPKSSANINITSEQTFSDIDQVVSLEFFGKRHWGTDIQTMSSSSSMQSIDTNGSIYTARALFHYSTNKVIGNFRQNVTSNTLSVTDFKFIFEYTKTTDTAVTNKSELTTLINYLPSNSTTGDYVVKSLDDVGVRVLKNYSYDSNTDSCIPPVN